jgi:tetratricopeptide (TPR) repeat protein
MYQVHYSAEQGRLVAKAADGSNLARGGDFYIGQSADMERVKHVLTTTTETIPMEVQGTDEQAIAELPERIRDVLFNENATRSLQPGEYPMLLSIARKLMELSDTELEAFRARSVGTTTSLATFEASVDRYIAEMRQRREVGQERKRTKQQLNGLDKVYLQYLSYVSMQNTASTLSAVSEATAQSGTSSPGAEAAGMSIATQITANKMADELTANLQPHDFKSITEFEQAIHEFERAFRDETVLIGREMLDRYEHVLYEQEQRYQKTKETTALHKDLQPARQHFQQAIDIRKEHAQTPWTPDEMAEQSYWSGQFQQERAQGRAAVTALSDTHPLLPGMDPPQKEELALASETDIQSVMLSYIRDRRSDVQKTRRNLASTPEMVYDLDTLLQTSFQQQGVRPGSIYQSIIEHHIRDTAIERAMINLAIAVFAIAAGVVSGGTGTVAVLGATAALGVGAYQAFEEYKRYEMMSAAHGAQLLTDDPSFAWVVVALVGVGLDLAAVGSAMRTLRPAVEVFNESGDLVALEKQLAQLTQVEERIRRSVVRAAKAEAEARAAWKSVLRPPAALRAVIIPGAEEFARLVYAVYLSIKRGIFEFELFVKTREAVDLIGDITKLAPEELTSLKAAYTQANMDLLTIAKQGESLGMSESEVEAFLRMWNNRSGMKLEQVTQEMQTWRAARQSGVPFGFKSAEHFEEFKNTAQTELRRILKKSDPDAQAFLQGSSVTGISYEKQVPFGVKSDLDVAISSRYLYRQARTQPALFEVSPSPSRIGPLTEEQIDILGLKRLHDRLSRVLNAEAEGAAGATPQRDINFLLFDNEKAVTKPIGEASKEVVRPTIPLGGEG